MTLAAVATTIALALAPPLPATTLTVITISDTHDATIGTGASGNESAINSYMKGVATTLGLHFNGIAVDGSKFTCSDISTTLANTRFGQSDIVVVYYSGHGFRGPTDSSQFPSFFCGAAGPYPSLSTVAQSLGGQARLTLAVADTCNVVVPQLTERIAPIPKRAVPRQAQLANLFTKYTGYLILSGSQPGQYSWYLPTGGLFTNQLLSAFDSATEPAMPGLWSDVVSAATKTILVHTSDTVVVTQQPIADVAHLQQSTPATLRQPVDARTNSAILLPHLLIVFSALRY